MSGVLEICLKRFFFVCGSLGKLLFGKGIAQRSKLNFADSNEENIANEDSFI